MTTLTLMDRPVGGLEEEVARIECEERELTVRELIRARLRAEAEEERQEILGELAHAQRRADHIGEKERRLNASARRRPAAFERPAGRHRGPMGGEERRSAHALEALGRALPRPDRLDPAELRALAGRQESFERELEARFQHACEALERGSFVLLAGERTLRGLDERIALDEQERVTFLRLVPLAGG